MEFSDDHAQTSAIVFSLAGLLFPTKPVEAAGPPTTKATTSTVVDNLIFQTAPSGLQYADAKVGTGVPITQKGSPVAIDYVMSTTGARYGTKIYSTSDKGAPYRFILGDGTTIAGLEQAIAGDEKVEPMRPGGIRRVIIPSTLGYESLARPIPGMQVRMFLRKYKNHCMLAAINLVDLYQRQKEVFFLTTAASRPK